MGRTTDRPERVRRWLESGGSLSPLTITLLYFAVSVAWILFSDQLVAAIPDRELAERLQSVKGLAFVLATSGVMFVLINRYRRMLLAEGEVRAAERAQREQLDRLLTTLRPGPTPQVTAQRICSALAGLPGIALATFLSARDDVDLLSTAAAPRAGLGWDMSQPLPRELSRQLLRRAGEGVWLVDDPERDSGPGAWLAAAGYREALVAPAWHAGSLVGVVIAAGYASASVAHHRHSVGEVARVAGAWLGPFALAERDQDGRRAALRTDAQRLEVVFQPIVTLADGQPVGYEALARFPSGASPAESFAEAAALGMTAELEEAAVRRALAEGAKLPAGRWLFLNVSAVLLQGGERLGAALAEADDRPIVLELTEQQPIGDYAAIRASLEAFGPRVRLALDDMGEAFSGLHHLVELTPAFAKLDLALVRDIDADPVRQALVAGLRQYALQTNAELIAEGVETVAERRTLEDLGVRLAQGYLFARPAPVGQVVARESASDPVQRMRPRRIDRQVALPAGVDAGSSPGNEARRST